MNSFSLCSDLSHYFEISIFIASIAEAEAFIAFIIIFQSFYSVFTESFPPSCFAYRGQSKIWSYSQPYHSFILLLDLRWEDRFGWFTSKLILS